jgi:hypothetical protein
VEASRKHGPFDTRWPCQRRDDSGAMPTARLGAAVAAEAFDRTAPTRLSLVPREHLSVGDELEREEAGTQRLLAAIAVAHPREAH